jgi:hypothetical protein
MKKPITISILSMLTFFAPGITIETFASSGGKITSIKKNKYLPSQIREEDVEELISKLNKSITSTYRLGPANTEYNVKIVFNDRGCTSTLSYRSGSYTYGWDEMAGLAITGQNRVYLAFSNNTFEYLTPTSGVSPSTVLNLVDKIAQLKTGHSIRRFGSTIKDEQDVKTVAAQTSQYSSGDSEVLEKILLGLLAVGTLVYLLFGLK